MTLFDGPGWIRQYGRQMGAVLGWLCLGGILLIEVSNPGLGGVGALLTLLGAVAGWLIGRGNT